MTILIFTFINRNLGKAWHQGCFSFQIMDKLCIICKEKLGVTDVVTVGNRARSTLVLASIKQDDGLQQALEKTPLRVHVACHKTYTHESTITAEKRKLSDSMTQQEKVPQLRSGVSTFHIKHNCIFCSEVITVDNKIPQESCNNVKTLEFKETVLNHAKDRRWLG